MNVLMPQLGETVAEGKVITWFKAVGDMVAAGDKLFEIETDKVTMEIEATEAGTLSAINVPVGEIAPVGAVVAVIGGNGGAAPVAKLAAAPVPASPQMTVSAKTASSTPIAKIKLDPFFEVRTPARNYGDAKGANGILSTPRARRLASEAGIELGRIKGSGPHSRIVAGDVAAAGVALAARTTPVGATAADVMALCKDTPFEAVSVDGMRRTIAARLLQAKQSIPHFYVVSDADVAALSMLREQINAAAPKGKDGAPAYKLSLNDFIIKAWAAALGAVPAANAVWAEDRILRFSRADIAVAVTMEGGMITPILRDVETKSVKKISAEVRDLVARARARKLMPNEYRGGSTTISNLGMYGVREFSAIINPPHATILAVGTTRREAIEKPDGGVAFASIMTVTLSADHRVVDGVLGAELLAAFKRIVENPYSLVA
jgi:pyruvate dehydrogenase E2 component (dihydrolipoyllysine-residue acetyltransferase)